MVPHIALPPPDNWAVALTDIARLVRASQPEEAYECLTAAASKYAQSLAAQPDNPQACNNWCAAGVGVVLVLPVERMPVDGGPMLLLQVQAARCGGCSPARRCPVALHLAAAPPCCACRACRGLVLQDLASLRPASERAAYLHHSCSKFRRALRLRPGFDRVRTG